MQFIDLQQAIARLAADPRVEPSTPIVVRGTGAVWKIEIAEAPRRIIIYCTP